MAEQRGGWPMGLQPLNTRVGLVRGRDFSGSVSFNTLITGSPSSSADSSSDLDTESAGSFFHDNSITLGSLIGLSSGLKLSRRSIGGRKPEGGKEKESREKSRRWFLCLCSRDRTDGESVEKSNAPSLAQFLAVERRAASEYRETQAVVAEPNSLFVGGRVAPPPTNHGSEVEKSSNGVLELFSCVCARSQHSGCLISAKTRTNFEPCPDESLSSRWAPQANNSQMQSEDPPLAAKRRGVLPGELYPPVETQAKAPFRKRIWTHFRPPLTGCT